MRIPGGNRLVLLDSTKGLLITNDGGRMIGNDMSITGGIP